MEPPMRAELARAHESFVVSSVNAGGAPVAAAAPRRKRNALYVRARAREAARADFEAESASRRSGKEVHKCE